MFHLHVWTGLKWHLDADGVNRLVNFKSTVNLPSQHCVWPQSWLTFPSIFFQYCLHRMTAITARSSRMMPTRQPIRIAVLLLSSLATGSPGLGVLAANSGSREGKIQEECQECTHVPWQRARCSYLWNKIYNPDMWTYSIPPVCVCVCMATYRLLILRALAHLMRSY